MLHGCELRRSEGSVFDIRSCKAKGHDGGLCLFSRVLYIPSRERRGWRLSARGGFTAEDTGVPSLHKANIPFGRAIAARETCVHGFIFGGSSYGERGDRKTRGRLSLVGAIRNLTTAGRIEAPSKLLQSTSKAPPKLLHHDVPLSAGLTDVRTTPEYLQRCLLLCLPDICVTNFFYMGQGHSEEAAPASLGTFQ